jgi:hypothetical protein
LLLPSIDSPKPWLHHGNLIEQMVVEVFLSFYQISTEPIYLSTL